jgi:hypothetical protein
MITILYPTYLPAAYKLVDRLCRQYSAEIILEFSDQEGYQVLTSIEDYKEEEVLEHLARYSSLFRLRQENNE